MPIKTSIIQGIGLRKKTAKQEQIMNLSLIIIHLISLVFSYISQ